MSLLEAILLGIVQGFSEFLPISSSGHLVLLQTLFDINEPVMMFDVMLHVGTLIPVFVVYRKDILSIICNPFQKLTLLLIVGTLPAVAAALLFGDVIEKLFGGGILLSVGFFITGILLLCADRIKAGHKRIRDVSYIDALLVGLMQAVAITPAISRSGSTITASLARGLDRKTAARFSFLLSVPAILGALTLEISKVVLGSGEFVSVGLAQTVLGSLAAMLTGYLAITFMIKLVAESKLRYFSVYVFGLGIFVIIFELFIK